MELQQTLNVTDSPCFCMFTDDHLFTHFCDQDDQLPYDAMQANQKCVILDELEPWSPDVL